MTLQSLKTELPMDLTSYRVIDFVLRYPQLDGSTHEASIPVGLDDDSGFQFMKEEFVSLVRKTSVYTESFQSFWMSIRPLAGDSAC
jgi:hypothetical protein